MTVKKDDRMSVTRIYDEARRLIELAQEDAKALGDLPNAQIYFKGYETGIQRLCNFIERTAR